VSTRAVVAAAAAIAAGTAAAGGRGSAAWWLSAACAAAIVGALALRSSPAVAVAVAVAAAGLAGAADAAWRARADAAKILPRLARDEAVVRLCGGVTASGPRSAVAEAREVTSAGHHWRVREAVRVSPQRGTRAQPLRPGSRVCASGSLRAGRDRDPPLIVAATIRTAGVASPVRFAAAVVRERFARSARRALPELQAGLLLGMTDGDTDLIDDDTMEAFRTTGLAHLVAVSGQNVSIFLALVVVAARLLIRRGRWLRVALIGPPLVFFAFLSSLEPSVLRAVITAALVLAVTASGRTTDALRATSMSFIVLVLLSPDLVGSIGFQLSFGATIGLVLWASALSQRIASWLAPPEPGRIATAAGAALGTTLAAQLAVAPLLAWHFGRIPAFGGVANLLAVPLAPVVTVAGLATLAMASLWSGFAWAPALLRILLDAILAIARGFAVLPGASVHIDPFAAAALTLGLVALTASASRPRTTAVAVGVVLVAASCGRAASGLGHSCDGGEVRAIDVGQGSAVLLRAGGHSVLVDGGPEAGHVERALGGLGIKRIDLLLMTHPHLDHVQGFVRVLERFAVGELAGPLTMDWGVGHPVVEAARSRRVRVRVVSAGDRFAFGPRLRMEIVAPEAGPEPPRTNDEIDTHSIVARAVVGGLPVVLPGDINVRGAQELRESGRDVRAPVLVAPHHGSANLDPAFVDDVDPELTLITVGARNRYGHPAPRALRIYKRHGPILRTDLDGSIAVCAGPDGAEARAGA
jgi:competence protein ComEC